MDCTPYLRELYAFARDVELRRQTSIIWTRVLSGAPWSCGGAGRGAEPDRVTGGAWGARGRCWLPGREPAPRKAERGTDNWTQVQLRRWQGAARRAELGSTLRATEIVKVDNSTVFAALREEIAALKQDIAVKVKDITRDLGDLGQRVHILEEVSNSSEEELDYHHHELLKLRGKIVELDYQMEDVKTDPDSPIANKEVPLQAHSGKLKDYVTHLLQHMAPDLTDQDIVQDRTHRES
ncbi:hypothetical protein NDU88_004993 [Pleurodeles waltl]|uniref:Uncharacterized protein n=1 Tax=Pleurodeles waltl TaxID=8319 RepID=A0AAV7RKR2_PLEWA|nr:hypothetical protein NDU88_004993 [Pleurodeles waltl]